jgi:AbiV family abortive infection protein
MTSKRLSLQDVHAVGIAALGNALDLMGDAEVLLRVGRPTTAYAVGVIAVEELAKYYRCRAELRRWSGELTVAALNELLNPGRTAHIERYAETLGELHAFAPSVPLPPGFDDLTAVAEVDMRARERALYVEVAPNGRLMTPAGVVEAEARLWLSAMVDHFAMLARVRRSALDEELALATGAEPSEDESE